MKQLALLLTVSTSLTLTAITAAFAQGNSRVYIMKKDGKLTEVVNGKQEAVTHDVILPNHATVHPDGRVDDIDGNAKTLNEGEYISFVDGRIRKLSASPAAVPATTTTKHVTPTTTKKPASKS
ncbi:MAG TPA: DUF6799 domain-containing protein [Puia sp.]|uniref:DUF6799 domain-containing protein n=1 Tax=Puia sp. TaxID=2045100 RepID=UPI002CEFB146|nr:DUF6799 domain-containing protein [Puia sp.]HVU95266.1 DUF6799 domain-containing protein [Puia sp.]